MDPDALLHPVGPLPATVYWIRRAVLAAMAAITVAILLLLVNWLAGRGGPPSRTGAALVRSHSPTPVTPSPTPVTPSPSPSTQSSPTASPSPAVVPACPDRVLSVKAATDATVYPSGRQPILSVTIRNTGTAACRRDVGLGARGLTIRSGSDRIWSSDDCEGAGSARVTLAPGAAKSFAVRWARVRSEQSCPGRGTAARDGTYRLYARLGSITSGPAVFYLR